MIRVLESKKKTGGDRWGRKRFIVARPEERFKNDKGKFVCLFIEKSLDMW